MFLSIFLPIVVNFSATFEKFFRVMIWSENLTETCHIIQIWTGYEGNSAKYMPEGVRVDNYFPRP